MRDGKKEDNKTREMTDCHSEGRRHEKRKKKIEEMRRVKMGVGNGREKKKPSEL